MRSLKRVIVKLMLSFLCIVIIGVIAFFSYRFYKINQETKKYLAELDYSKIKNSKITIYDSDGNSLFDGNLNSEWITFNSDTDSIITKIDSTYKDGAFSRKHRLRKALRGSELNSLPLLVFHLYFNDSSKSIVSSVCKKIQKTFTNEQLAEVFYNRAYFRNNYFGFDDASHGYFNKEIGELSDSQIQFLISLSLDEHSSIEELIKEYNVEIEDQDSSDIKNYVLENVMNYCNNDLKKIRKGITVNSTLDAGIQKQTDKIMKKYNGEAILVIDNSSGKVVSVSGNNVMGKKYIPGQVIKPNLVWLPALCGKYNLESQITDEKIADGPKNLNNKYYGVCKFSKAVATASNVVAWNIFTQIGNEKCYSYINKMGYTIDNSIDNTRYVSIGEIKSGITLDNLANLYYTIFNGGIYTRVDCIDSLGKAVDQECEIVYDYEAASEMVYCLEETVKNGICKKYQLNRNMPSACYYDSDNKLYCGFSPYYTIIVSGKNSGKIFKSLQDKLCESRAVISLTEAKEDALSEREDYSDLIAQIDAELAKRLKLLEEDDDKDTSEIADESGDYNDGNDDYTVPNSYDDNKSNFGTGDDGSINGEDPEDDLIEYRK